MIVLGIETSCDDTCVSLVADGKHILSNAVSSQEAIHRRFGGVVPEIASRQHDAFMVPVYEEALEEAGIGASDIDAVAVTFGPGLIGSLLVGLSFAKALAFAQGWPLIGVSHLDGHLYSPILGGQRGKGEQTNSIPRHIGLVASGGHTSLFLVESATSHKLLGATADDAVGESFDKVAKFVGLPYPGGPVLEREASQWNGELLGFPRPSISDRPYWFSFSGLKTAVINRVTQARNRGGEIPLPQLAASFQEAVADVLVERTVGAAEENGVELITFSGGVACNAFLRGRLEARARESGRDFLVPTHELCTDNAAMIAGVGYHYLKDGKRSDLTLTAQATLAIEPG
jgi:N6-L-threonylcarbamoyladenine synthase